MDTKWNESGFTPLLCTYRLNWARGTYWGWWDEWDDTALQTQDSKFKPWRPEAEHSATEAPHDTEFHEWMGKKHFCFFQIADTGKRTPNFTVKGSGANHYPRAPPSCGHRQSVPQSWTWYGESVRRSLSFYTGNKQIIILINKHTYDTEPGSRVEPRYVREQRW